MARVLRTDVYVDYRCYSAGSTPPDDIARRITNPSAWDGDDDTVVADPPAPETHDDGEDPVTPEPTEPAGAPAGGAQSPADAGQPGVVQRPDAPPRSGKGSGLSQWQDFARTHNVSVPDGADRSDVIAACEAAGVIDTE